RRRTASLGGNARRVVRVQANRSWRERLQQSTDSLHDKVLEALLDVAEYRCDTLEDLHGANGVFNQDPFAADLAVLFLLFRAQLLATRFLGGLLRRGSFGGITLESDVLEQGTS